MNYATALELPTSWATDAQRYSYKAIRYTSFAFKAFNQEIAPVLGEALKDRSHYYVQCLKGVNRWAMKISGITHNPISAAIRSAHAELTSTEAQATYRRLQHIATESAMDALVIGLCGVVAVAQGVEAVQKIYGFAKQVYRWVDDRINPLLEQPTLLPTVDLCLAHLSDAELAARIESLVDPLLLEVVDEAIAPSSESTPLQSTEDDECPTEDEPVAFWNPAPKDMHIEVQQMLQATAAPATTEAELVGSLDVPGAIGKRTSRAKASTPKAEVKPKGARAKAKV
jgi:hypothetical protein